MAQDELRGDWSYREAVGCLMWLSIMTRPTTFNGVRAVAHHSHNPTERHWKAALKITACLEGTRGVGLTLVRGLGLGLTAYSNADHGVKYNDRRLVVDSSYPGGCGRQLGR
ncbi:unnamed protein product [Scytosiphon promiscuus]